VTPHPVTGAIYIVVIPPDPALSDLRACYLYNEAPWLRLVTTSDFPAVFDRHRDDCGVVIHWAPSYLWVNPIPLDRRLTVVGVWSEAYDPDLSKLSDEHQSIYKRFVSTAPLLDAIACHTPWMAAQFRERTGRPTIVLPHGWDRRAMGEPVWGTGKTSEAIFYGSMVGKRAAVLEELVKYGLGRGLSVQNGVFGRKLIETLNTTKCVLNIYHWDCASYSTWRLFQAACSSAALVTEDGDIWPLSPAARLTLPFRVSVETVPDLAATICSLSHGRATLIAEAAFAEIQSFTMDSVINNYIVDQTETLLR